MFLQFDSLFAMMQVFTDEKKCVDHFRAVRWPNGVSCPHCGSGKIYHLSNGTHKCGESQCAEKFSVRYNTIFEDSKISLQKWFMAIYLVTSHNMFAWRWNSRGMDEGERVNALLKSTRKLEVEL